MALAIRSTNVITEKRDDNRQRRPIPVPRSRSNRTTEWSTPKDGLSSRVSNLLRREVENTAVTRHRLKVRSRIADRAGSIGRKRHSADESGRDHVVPAAFNGLCTPNSDTNEGLELLAMNEVATGITSNVDINEFTSPDSKPFRKPMDVDRSLLDVGQSDYRSLWDYGQSGHRSLLDIGQSNYRSFWDLDQSGHRSFLDTSQSEDRSLLDISQSDPMDFTHSVLDSNSLISQSEPVTQMISSMEKRDRGLVRRLIPIARSKEGQEGDSNELAVQTSGQSKRLDVPKGGLASRLRSLVQKQQSDIAVWRHRTMIGTQIDQRLLIAVLEKKLYEDSVCVAYQSSAEVANHDCVESRESDSVEQGVVSNYQVLIIFPRRSVDVYNLAEGKRVKIVAPYLQLSTGRFSMPVIVGPAFMDTVR